MPRAGILTCLWVFEEEILNASRAGAIHWPPFWWLFYCWFIWVRQATQWGFVLVSGPNESVQHPGCHGDTHTSSITLVPKALQVTSSYDGWHLQVSKNAVVSLLGLLHEGARHSHCCERFVVKISWIENSGRKGWKFQAARRKVKYTGRVRIS